MGKRVAIYVRVSTDKQTIENQLREPQQIAQRRGWEVVHEYHDAGVSGAKSRETRPGLDEMLKDAQRRLVMAWAIDRLGRSLIDLLGTIQALEACGVDLYLDQQSIDTTTPAGRLMFQITGAFAEFERSMIRQGVRAGLKRAVESGKQLGRPKIDPAKEKRIKAQLRAKKGMLAITRDLKVGTGTVQGGETRNGGGQPFRRRGSRIRKNLSLPTMRRSFVTLGKTRATTNGAKHARCELWIYASR